MHNREAKNIEQFRFLNKKQWSIHSRFLTFGPLLLLPSLIAIVVITCRWPSPFVIVGASLNSSSNVIIVRNLICALSLFSFSRFDFFLSASFDYRFALATRTLIHFHRHGAACNEEGGD